MLPGLARDAVTIQRQANTVDVEGDYVGALSTVYDGRGTYGSPRASDLVLADQRGQRIDAVLAVTSDADAEPGDVATLKGETWAVVAVMDVRTHQRVLLRRAE